MLHDLPKTQQDRLRLDLLQGDLGVTVGRSFETFLRQSSTGLTAADVFSTDTLSETVIHRFSAANIDQQQSIMENLVQQIDQYPLNESENATRFNTLLNLMPADGQYATALKLADVPNLLEDLYEAAQTAPPVKQLYDQLTAIGLNNGTD